MAGSRLILILVFQIKFCGKSPALRVAAKRWAQYPECVFEYDFQRFLRKLNPKILIE